jgi:hypothetical protein
MREGESGVCELTVEARRFRVVCSPGPFDVTFAYIVLRRTHTAVIVDATAQTEPPRMERLRIETLRSPSGARALRIKNVVTPEASPFRAYGHPDVWIAGTVRD